MKTIKTMIINDKKFIAVTRSKCGHYYVQIKIFVNGVLQPLTSKHRVTLKWLQENYPNCFKRKEKKQCIKNM